MRSSGRAIPLATQATLVLVAAALLWSLGYAGGRSAGLEQGREAGLAQGEADGVRETLEFLAFAKGNSLSVSVADLVSRRLGASLWTLQTVDAEVGSLIQEICDEVAPGSWNLDGDRGNRIKSIGTTLIVQGDPQVVAEVELYLTSDGYREWKQDADP